MSAFADGSEEWGPEVVFTYFAGINPDQISTRHFSPMQPSTAWKCGIDAASNLSHLLIHACLKGELNELSNKKCDYFAVQTLNGACRSGMN